MKAEAQLIITPDHNVNDTLQAIDEMVQRAYFTQAWLDGNVETDTFIEYLLECGVELDDFLASLRSRQLILV